MEGYVNRPLAVVSIAARVRAYDARRLDAKTRLLEDLPLDGLIWALSRLDEATWELPAPSIRLLATLEHQIASVLFYKGKRGDRRVLVMDEMLPATSNASAIGSVCKQNQLIAAEGAEAKLHQGTLFSCG